MDTIFTADSMPHLRAVLEEYGAALLAAYRENLLPRNAGGDLITTATARVESDGEQWSVVFNLQDYWKYIEDGTRPHWPPPGSLIPWIRVKPVIPSPDSRGRIPSEKSLDFLIRRRIAGKAPDGNGGFKPGGTTGSHDLERAEQDLVGQWLPRIQQALALDASEHLRVYITETFREINPRPVEL